MLAWGARGSKLMPRVRSSFYVSISSRTASPGVYRDLAVSNWRARHKTRRFLRSSTLTLASHCATGLHPLPAHGQIRAIPRLNVAHNRPPARRARLPFVPDQQVLDHPVELRMFIAAQPEILLEPNVPRSPDSPRLRHRRERPTDQSPKLFTRKLIEQILFSHGARFYLLAPPVQQYFRTTRRLPIYFFSCG
jgi:hypothetical protein